MLNYDAFVRLIELHCRRTETSSGMHEIGGRAPSRRPPWSTKMTGRVGGGVGDGEAGGAVGGGGRGGGGGGGEESASSAPLWGAGGALTKEKAMKVWLLERPLFSSRDLNR